MTAGEICNELFERSEINKQDVASALGISPPNLANRFKRNSLTADDFFKIIEMLGYEFKIVKSKTGEEIEPWKKGVGERIRMVVNGIRYDTYMSNAICHSDETQDVFYELYQDKYGRYFVAHYVNWEGGINSISPIGAEDAQRMIERLG